MATLQEQLSAIKNDESLMAYERCNYLLAILESRDETYAINNHLEATDTYLALCAESGIATDRDADAIWILENPECDESNPECDFGMEPVDNYDGELNDRYVYVCRIHN